MINEALAHYLRTVLHTPFVWGQHDCALFIADWVLRCTGSDPAAHLRGRYANEAEANALLGVFGLTMTVRRCAKTAGLVRTRAPAAGDIAVIRSGRTAICAIRATNGWFVRDDHRISKVRDAKMVLAWTVPQ